ncbi:MAG: YIP1 family protein [Acidobacteriota bacterium]|nr:YIP1 family protein [Acidobacteriota bacterium]
MGGQPEASRHLWFKALIWIFTAPRKSFVVIREHHPWVAGLAVGSSLIVLAVLLTTSWFADAMNSIGDPLEIPYGMVSFAFAAIPLLLLVEAVVLRLVAAALKGRARFEQCLSLALHVGLVGAVGLVVRSLLSTTRVDGILGLQRNVLDSRPDAGLDVLGQVAEMAPGAILDLMIHSFVFVWSFLLLGLGAAAVFRLSRPAGFAIAAINWAAGKVLEMGLAGLAVAAMTASLR